MHGPPDPFETLGLPARFKLAAQDIGRAYLARAAACHPDLAGAGGDEALAAAAARTAAALNDARAVLLDPESRARALLARLDPGGASDRTLPEGFLAEIMATRLGLEEAIEGGKPADLDRWREWAAGERGSSIDRIAGLFAGLGDPPAAAGLVEIRRRLNAWRYIERMIEQIPD
jgi:curved DNA-binding protein CbpA